MVQSLMGICTMYIVTVILKILSPVAASGKKSGATFGTFISLLDKAKNKSNYILKIEGKQVL